MRDALQIIKAEMVKYHRNTFFSLKTYFSLLIWPILLYLNSFYSYKVFKLNQEMLYGFNSSKSLITFLITGLLGYNCFWSLVQSAWQMRFERQDGTLEIIFLSSANRMSVIYGRVLGALFENVWMFFLFSTFAIGYSKSISIKNIIYLPPAFVILISAAIVWGGLINVIFLFSRDASILFNIFDQPMSLFSGVRIPTAVFPTWAKGISILFPLTHALVIVRTMLINGGAFYCSISFYILIALNLLIVALTALFLRSAEKYIRRTGNLLLY